MTKLSHLFSAAMITTTAILSTGCGFDHSLIDASDERIKISGRVVYETYGRHHGDFVRTETMAKWSYPGVTISTKFIGSKITMFAKPNSGFLMVEVDGKDRKKIGFTEANYDDRIVLADSLDKNKIHSVKVVYCNEGHELQPEFHGFKTDGELIKDDTEKKNKFYFIGNSITCGYGVDGDRSQTFNYETEDFTKTFAYQVSEKYDAEYIVFAKSGYGIYRNYGDAKEGSTVNMSTLYDYTLFCDTTYKWDHNSFKADVVFLNLGTNDTSEDNYDIQRFKSAAKNFVAKVRATNPNSKLILMTGPMMHDKALSDVMTTLDEIAFQMAKDGDDKVYRFNFTPDDGKFGYGTDWHPSAEKQNDMTRELMEFMEKHEIVK